MRDDFPGSGVALLGLSADAKVDKSRDRNRYGSGPASHEAGYIPSLEGGNCVPPLKTGSLRCPAGVIWFVVLSQGRPAKPFYTSPTDTQVGKIGLG